MQKMLKIELSNFLKQENNIKLYKSEVMRKNELNVISPSLYWITD